jgi:hypothetical protein
MAVAILLTGRQNCGKVLVHRMFLPTFWPLGRKDSPRLWRSNVPARLAGEASVITRFIGAL